MCYARRIGARACLQGANKMDELLELTGDIKRLRQEQLRLAKMLLKRIADESNPRLAAEYLEVLNQATKHGLYPPAESREDPCEG